MNTRPPSAPLVISSRSCSAVASSCSGGPGCSSEISVARVAGDADGQPAVVALLDVVALLEPELVDVEVERLVLVEDVDRGDVQPGDHVVVLLLACRWSTRSYGATAAEGFSKTARLRARSSTRATARPHGRQLDAVRRDHRAVPRAVVRRRLADDLAERAAERSQAGEADVEADVGDAAVGLAQQEHRALDPPPLQVAVGRLAEHGPEAAAEVRLARRGRPRPRRERRAARRRRGPSRRGRAAGAG